MVSEVEQLQARFAALKAAVQDLVRIHEGRHDVGCVTAVLENPYGLDPVSLEDEKGELTFVEGGHDVGCDIAVLENPYGFDPVSLECEKGDILVEYGHDVGCGTPALMNLCSSEILPKKRSMTSCGWSLVCGALLPRTSHQQSLDEVKGEILVEYGYDVGCVTPVLKNQCSFEILPKKRSMTRCGWSLICIIDTLDSKNKVSTGNTDTSSAVVLLAEEIEVSAPWPMTSSFDNVWRATRSVSLDHSFA